MEIFKLFGSIFVNTDEAEKSIAKTGEKAEGVGNKFSNVFGKIGKAAIGVAKVGAAAIGGIATGVAALTKSAISNYADYEQLVGGVETLFKDSSDKVVQYANDAYKTAGLSANEYMETVTSFSASLLQSLDGDTAKAAEKANLAITDMSDNANKMGTSMESIQNAYQGFAKQNYTMLDNLKLGYGGTKEEMQRLLDDAEKLSGIKYDLSSYSDIVDAIHVVQTEMGITGTTAKEASSTISGSIGMMKSAWTNFLTGMADPNQDFDALLGNLVDSVVTVADNIVPRIAETLPRIVAGLSGVIQTLATYMPDIIGKLLPALLSGATALFGELVKGIPTLIQTLAPTLIDSLKTILSTVFGSLGLGDLFDEIFSDGFAESMKMFVDTALSSVLSILPVIIEFLAMLLPPLMEVAQAIFPVIVQLLGAIVPIIQAILPLLQPLLDIIVMIIQPIAELISTILPPLIEMFTQMIEMVMPYLTEQLQMLALILSGVLAGAFSALKPIVENVIGIFQGLIDFIQGVFTGNWEQAWGGVIQIFSNLFEGLVNIVKAPLNAIIGGINEVFSSIGTITVPDWVPKIGGKQFSLPNLPMLAKGGNIISQGEVIVGEEGPEILDLPVGARVTPLDKAQNNNLDYGLLKTILVDALNQTLGALDLKAIIQLIPDNDGLFKIVWEKNKENANAGKAAFPT